MPAPVTTLSYHVAGPVVLQATVGTLYAWATVGVCEDGIDIQLQHKVYEIKPDGGGGTEGTPVGFVFLNAQVLIRCTLVPFSGTYVNALRAAAQADINGVDGIMPESGNLFSVYDLVAVKFTSLDVDGGWRFPSCLVSSAGNAKAGVQESKPLFEFRAINYYDPVTTGSIYNSVLYSRI